MTLPDDSTPEKTRPVSKRLRFEVLRRDNHTCRYCGASAPDVKLTVDHVTPVTLGGTNDPANLVTACQGCNAGKSSTSPNASVVEDVSADALRWARAMERASAITRANREDRDARRTAFQEYWENFRFKYQGQWYAHDLPGERWKDSLDRLHEAGLTFEDACEAVDVTMRSKNRVDDLFRYFCGVAWRMVRERQEIARQLLDAEDA